MKITNYKLQIINYKGSASSEQSESKGLPRAKSRGFTLIELLVSLAIIVLLTVLAIPTFKGSGENNKLNLTAQEVKNAILEAKNYALSPRAEKDNQINTYSIFFDVTNPNSNSYYIKEGDNTLGATVKYLPKGIIFSTATEIQFGIKEQGQIILPLLNPTNPDIVIVLHSNTLNKNKTITINQVTGEITIN